MPNKIDPAEERQGEIRLSQQLAAMHVVGLAFLLVVISTSLLWISAEHNRLARDASFQLVRGGIFALRSKLDVLVRDYSVWDEAHEAARAGDRDWLYDNIGNAAAEIGTLDLIVFVNPRNGETFGWRHGSPPEGQTGLLPPDVLAMTLGMLEGRDPVRAMFATFDDEIWALAVAPVVPVAGTAPGIAEADLPRQIHGFLLSQERLDEMAKNLLIEGGLSLEPVEGVGQSRLELADATGAVVAEVRWTAPRPGASILRQILGPLALALGVVAAVALFSARSAFRSARRLELALEAAQAADRMKSEFLSNVTHELRTPMNGIIGVAQLLEMTEIDGEQRELLGILDASARTQMSLINDLLDFARLESGHAALQAAPYAPVDVLDEVAGLVRAGIAGRPVVLETDWRSLGGLRVSGDPRAFRQVVTNLLGNAAKFTERGRITARAWAATPGDWAEITIEIADTGIGIPGTELERIFDRFHRVDGSLTRATEGAGLGLAISQRLAGLMGGRIEVESALGVGSTFRFRVSLPLAERPAERLDAA